MKTASVCVEFVCRDNLQGNESGIGTGEQLSSFEKRQEKVWLHFILCVLLCVYDNILLQLLLLMCAQLMCTYYILLSD